MVDIATDRTPIAGEPYGTFDDTPEGRWQRLNQYLPVVSKQQLQDEHEEHKTQKGTIFRKLATEFFGTLCFVFFGGISLHNRVGPYHASGDIVSIALAHGLVICILIAALGHISGGHFNPAITLGVWLSHTGFKFIQMVCYVLVQLVGGYFGGLLIRASCGWTNYINFGGGTLNLNEKLATVGEGFCLELLMTMLVVAAVLMTAIDPTAPEKNIYAPFAIGLAILVDNLSGGTITGASMNPARSFGSLAAYSTFTADLNCTNFEEVTDFKCTPNATMWSTHWIAWAGPVAGALVAVFIYKAIFAEPKKNWFFKQD